MYLAGRVPIKTYLRYCTIFALSSVGTLLIIVGILSFMLWPGQDSWYQTGGVLSAFFGESMFAQLLGPILLHAHHHRRRGRLCSSQDRGSC